MMSLVTDDRPPDRTNHRRVAFVGVFLTIAGMAAALQWTKCTFTSYPYSPGDSNAGWQCVDGRWERRYYNVNSDTSHQIRMIDAWEGERRRAIRAELCARPGAECDGAFAPPK